MTDCCAVETATVVIRARECQAVWGTKQVLACPECGRRWAA